MDEQNKGLKRIADKLGISVTAVSRSIRNGDDISIDLKKRVWEEALANGYVSPAMRRAKASRSKTVMFIGNPADVTRGDVEAFKGIGRRLFVMPIFETVNLEDILAVVAANAESVIAETELDGVATVYAKLIDLPVFSAKDEHLLDSYKEKFSI